MTIRELEKWVSGVRLKLQRNTVCIEIAAQINPEAIRPLTAHRVDLEQELEYALHALSDACNEANSLVLDSPRSVYA